MPDQLLVQVDDGLSQRSMVRSLTVVFAGTASFAGDPADAFTLTDSDATAVPFAVALGTLGGDTTAVITPTDSALAGGSLADGRYTLTVLASQVSIDGVPLAADYPFPFFRLYGDADGDAAVGGPDFAAFRGTFGLTSDSPAYLDYMDYNADGAVNGTDFAQFRVRYGESLP